METFCYVLYLAQFGLAGQRRNHQHRRPGPDRESGERFVKSYEEAHTLVQSGDTKVVLQTGKDEWPFPIPLIKGSAGWRFDTPAGQEEIRKRRIGRNELDVIQVCLAYVDAQREYYVRNPRNDTLLQGVRPSSSARRANATDCIGKHRPTSRRAHGVPSWPGPDARATSVRPASLCPITVTITKCSPGRDPTRRVAPMTMWCVAR